MADIFDTKIICPKCNREMKKTVLERQGAEVRAVRCEKCKSEIIHPADLNCLEKFKDLKDKTFNVKLRMVGNSHAISIPKEIFDFMSEQQKMMNENHGRIRREMEDMVKLAFEDFGKLKLTFWGEGLDDEGAHESEGDAGNGKVRRKVKDYGNGNVDILEEQNLDDAEKGVRGFKVRKIIRRRGSD